MSNDEQEYGARFVTKYSELVTVVWRSDEELQRLLADPTGYATAAGLPVAPGAVVEVDRAQPETLYTKDQIVADWSGTPGRHVLHVPEVPLVDLNELSEAELESIAGGVAPAADNNVNIVAVLIL
ncbi:hypothetical protein [Micromonospora endolithica]|uniref:NHLP leader peptide family natural product n=1 Tax=Micromonospora endolithica TaxID=230091 RepID=A0A3A9ZHM0_9ACTN|nr:hypothetical protein [Micromonospora endolithica]RKN47595.1 hypothetical protein D7223_12560 [Micromonospora endolithica]TWJ21247.1 lactobin A/cerein 7B family class IIb bacteriocin [Micromonospora endolithica]